MWPLREHRFDPSVLELLRARGFECTPGASGRVQVRKGNVVALLERDASGKLRLTEPPGYLIRGQSARLWDAGYQKFWLLDVVSPEPARSPRVPVAATQLKELHRVSEEIRSLLGIPSFYNESLGTTCHVSAYDRLHGCGHASAEQK